MSGPLRARRDPRLRLAGSMANRHLSAAPPGNQSAADRQLPWQPHLRRAAIGRLERSCELIGGGDARWKHSNGARARGGTGRDGAAVAESVLHRTGIGTGPHRRRDPCTAVPDRRARTAARHRESRRGDRVLRRGRARGRERSPVRRRPGAGAAASAREPPGSGCRRRVRRPAPPGAAMASQNADPAAVPSAAARKAAEAGATPARGSVGKR